MATDPRLHITFRLGVKGYDWLTQVAVDHGVRRSEVIRHALAVAKKHEGEVIARIKDES